MFSSSLPFVSTSALSILSILLFHASAVVAKTMDIVVENPPPTILDTDYGSFIDDIFAVGLLLQSNDVLDPRLILTTSEHPDWSANCVSEQIFRSDLGYDVPVAMGETLPPYSERGTVCGIPGLIGFALEDTCKDNKPQQPILPNGVEYAAKLIQESTRTDWVYIVVGGQTSLQKLIREYPHIMTKIQTLVIMGGNWCTGFDAYPDVPTPTAETNIGCDINSANAVLELAAKSNASFPDIYYVPVAMVDVLEGNDYSLIMEAASPTNPEFSKAAEATIDFYKAWSVSARANRSLLVHKEAMTFDPATQSTPQFDACAVLVAMDVVRKRASARASLHPFANGIHFVTNPQEEQGLFGELSLPKAAYSLWSGSELLFDEKRSSNNPISHKCRDLTPHHFDPKELLDYEPVTIQAALGFVSEETKQDFFLEMALRISGRWMASTAKAATTSSKNNNTLEQETRSASSLSPSIMPEATSALLAMTFDELSVAA